MKGNEGNFRPEGQPYQKQTQQERPFRGTGSLGNYTGGGDHHGGHNNNHNSSGGLAQGAGFNRPNDQNVRNSNNNSFGNANVAHQGKDYKSFEKFRDFERVKSSRTLRRDRQRERRRNEQWGRRGRGGNYQNNDYQPRKEGLNWFDDSRSGKPLQRDTQQTPVEVMKQPNETTVYPPASNSPATAIPPATETPAANAQNTNVATNKPAVPVLDQQQIIKNIKQEKIGKAVTKPIIKPPSSSSSSSSDSSDSEKTTSSKPVQAALNNKLNKTEVVAKESTKKNIAKTASSSSSSSSSEEEDESDQGATKAAAANVAKSTKKAEKKKQSSEEELICLGKLERKFVIEDDASDEVDLAEDNVAADGICLICDKEGHTAFECQMICKNCSTPYHNMKSCPKPANLSIVMQSFMEFCMGQMNQFNPEQKFALPSYISNVKENKLTREAPVTASVNKKGKKKIYVKTKESSKKLTKRKRKRSAKSSDDEEDDDDDDDEDDVKKDYETEEEEPSTETESESDSSTEKAAPKSKKKKRAKTPSLSGVDAPEFPNSFIPPFSTFPSFGAAAAAYNPLLLSQLMHAGNFTTPKKRNFQ